MKKQREYWESRLGFIMATAGSAIGLGILWQFPYLTAQNGGGLFVLMYLVFTLLIGMPIFIGELILGRSSQRGAVGIFISLSKNAKFWKIAGWLGVLSSFLIFSYYSVVAGWGLHYVLLSINQFYVGRSPAEIRGVFEILHRSGDINLFWHFIFVLITAGIVYQGIRKGIEYWSRIMMFALIIVFLGLFCYSIRLEGFTEALRFIFYPDISKLKPSGVLEALGLAFFTLSLGQGIILTYGSYMKHSDSVPKLAITIVIMNTFIALLVSLVIFPILFSAKMSPEQGPGLIFKTLPMLFSKLPGTLVLSTCFFGLFVFAALTSAIAFLEVIVANFMDLFDWPRKKCVLIASISVFIFGIPAALSGSQSIFQNWSTMFNETFFTTVVQLVSNWFLPLSGLMIATFIGWFFDKDLCYKEFQSESGFIIKKLFIPWLFVMRWIAPIAILLIFLQKGEIISLDKLFSMISK